MTEQKKVEKHITKIKYEHFFDQNTLNYSE